MELVPGFEAKTALQFEIRVFGTMHYKLWEVGALLHCKFRGIENTNSGVFLHCKLCEFVLLKPFCQFCESVSH